MYNPNDDPDVTSGLQDDAKREMTYPGTSDQGTFGSKVWFTRGEI